MVKSERLRIFFLFLRFPDKSNQQYYKHDIKNRQRKRNYHEILIQLKKTLT